MKLSIIIPTYNSASLLKDALNSVLSQTFKDFEVLVMDGGSQDDTVKVAESFVDSRIKVFSEPDRGVYDAMNKGIAKAEGEWLYFLGSDDRLSDDKVLEKVFSAEDKGVDILYGYAEAESLENEQQGEWTIDKMEKNICHQAIFYSRRFFKRLGTYDLKYRIYADWDLNLRWLLSPFINKKYIDIPIATYAPGGLSYNRVDEVFMKDFNKNILRYGFFSLSNAKRMMYLNRYMRQYKLTASVITAYRKVKHLFVK